MKKYWLYLEPFTFIFTLKEEVLIYNSVSFVGRRFKNSNKLKKIISWLHDGANMYCLELTEEDIKAKEVKEFVNFIRKSFSGDLISSSEFKKPAIFLPVLSIHYDKERITNFRDIGDQILKLLSEVSIYVGGNNPSSSLSNIDVYKQFNYCKKTDSKFLSFEKIKKMINSLNDTGVQQINILGGNVFTYPDLNLLIDVLSSYSYFKCIYSTYKDLPENLELYPYIKDSQLLLRVLIDFPLDIQLLDKTINSLVEAGVRFECLFAVTSIKEYKKAENIVNKYKLQQFEIKPVFTGENIDFFQEYVYLSKNDILKTQTDRRNIFINQSLNLFYFGKINILENGKVYSDLNKPAIGGIDTPIIDLLYHEMTKSVSWLRVRKQKPCSNCVYQWLCPTPSAYEQVIGKPNLCTVK